MFKFKSQNPYWTEFSSYQTFQTVDELNNAVKEFISVYEITPAIKAVLNTIKLHSKRFFGVCWLRKEQIAKKAKVSPSTVDRAIKGLKETGFLKVIPFNHTKFGRQTHNIYILNPIENVAEEVPNEVAQESSEEPSKLCVTKDSDIKLYAIVGKLSVWLLREVVYLQRLLVLIRSDKLGRTLFAFTSAERLKIPRTTGSVDIFTGFSVIIC